MEQQNTDESGQAPDRKEDSVDFFLGRRSEITETFTLRSESRDIFSLSATVTWDGEGELHNVDFSRGSYDDDDILIIQKFLTFLRRRHDVP